MEEDLALFFLTLQTTKNNLICLTFSIFTQNWIETDNQLAGYYYLWISYIYNDKLVADMSGRIDCVITFSNTNIIRKLLYTSLNTAVMFNV